MSLLTEKVVIRHRGAQTGVDSLHRPVYGEPTTEEQPGWVDASVAPELTDSRETVTTAYTLYIEGLYDLSATDQVAYSGAVYELDGEPLKQPGGFLVGAYTQCSLKKVSG